MKTALNLTQELHFVSVIGIIVYGALKLEL